MIPQRVKLKGFLSYKDEQEISFDGNATLWMLSGLNGSGKSSIFDAVTYSLFGHHRGGGQHAHELINKDSDSLVVEFDFLLDGHAYRAKRTLRRDTRGGAKGTQQIFRLEGGINGHRSWVAVEDTGQKREFDAWVADNIGLTYDTFTSSVLLLQGKAEKLLDSKPEGRREVLASIVDLERYERLHRGADDERKAKEAALKALSNRLAAVPEVTPLELAAVEARIAAAEEARQGARAEVERLQGLEFEARRWVELQGRLTRARARWEQAQRLLVDAPAIEKAVERLRELREVLPRLHEITLLRGQVHEAEGKTRDLTKLKQKLLDQLAQRDHAVQQARDKRVAVQKLIADDEASQRDVVARLRHSSILLEKLKEHDRHESDLARVRDELSGMPDDPSAAVARAREACDRLADLARVVPILARFQARRDELRQALVREQTAHRGQQAVEARGVQLKAEVDRLKARVDETARGLQQATDQAAEARTLSQRARESLQELSQLDGAKVCRHCGQGLTPGHIKEEKRRRGAEAAAAAAKSQEAADALRAAQAAEKAARDQFNTADHNRQELRVEYSALRKEVEQAQADVRRLQTECTQLHAELPARFRAFISSAVPADWTATTYPTAAELQALHAEADARATARQTLRQAEQAQQQWGKLKAQEAATLANLNRLQAELPADRERLRADHAELEGRDHSLEKGLAANRAALKQTERELDRLTRERDDTRSQVDGCDNQLKEQDVVQQHARKTMAKALKVLPSSWHALAEKVGMAELHAHQKEQADLETAGTDERGRELHQARLNLDVLAQDRAALEAEQERFPPEARQDPAAIVARLVEARRADKTCEEDLSQARQQQALLEARRKQREQIAQEYLVAESDLAVLRTLAELLGRDRLQLYLVRQAERQVVEHANAVLDRLSGGQLYLKLSGEANGEGSSAKALELEAYNRSTGEQPINVAFLSGSQKFRVAVSLALGIGQYASRQHRPIESVIIDEGFGCLDSQGRQVMIQELQNLRGQMRCILLVSHQEEFADAFNDGYHFRLDNGATRVTRVQK